MVPADSDRIPRAPPYSGGSPVGSSLPVRAFHPLRGAFPRASRSLTRSFDCSYNPAVSLNTTVYALPLSIASTQGIDCFFLLLPVLRCFSSRGSLRLCRWMVFNHPGCPIRTSTDQSLLAAPRGFSQLATSFFASRSPGIPRSLLSSFSRESRSTLRALPDPEAFRDLSRFACETSVLVRNSI